MIDNIKQEFLITKNHKIEAKHQALMGSQAVITAISEWIKESDGWIEIKYEGVKPLALQLKEELCL